MMENWQIKKISYILKKVTFPILYYLHRLKAIKSLIIFYITRLGTVIFCTAAVKTVNMLYVKGKATLVVLMQAFTFIT